MFFTFKKWSENATVKTRAFSSCCAVMQETFPRYYRSSDDFRLFFWGPREQFFALKSWWLERRRRTGWVQTVKTNYFLFSHTFWWLSWASSHEHINHRGSCMIGHSFTSSQPQATIVFFQKNSSSPGDRLERWLSNDRSLFSFSSSFKYVRRIGGWIVNFFQIAHTSPSLNWTVLKMFQWRWDLAGAFTKCCRAIQFFTNVN